MDRATTAVQQSHAQDYAEFVPFMRARYNCSGADPDEPTSACPVVLFGGSYGGSAPASRSSAACGRYSENRAASQGDRLVWDTVPHGISYVGLCRIGSCRVVYHADKDTGIHALCDIVSYGIPACAVGCIITVCKYRRPAPSERMQPYSALRQCSWRGSG